MSMDKEDGFERGFVAGWKARGEHEDDLLIEAELAQRQVEDGRDEERRKYQAARWAQVEARQQQFAALSGQAFCKNCGFPAKTCVCVPQQVNQQSRQGATEVKQGGEAVCPNCGNVPGSKSAPRTCICVLYPRTAARLNQ